MSLTAATEALHAPFPLKANDVSFYAENGYVHLHNVFTPELIERYRPDIGRCVAEFNRNTKPLAERSTYDRAFLQITNLWRKSAVVREFVFGKRLAQIAGELMGCSGVRLWHDQALFKEAGGGHTPWHVDQVYWPVASDKIITAWIPLVDVPLEMGPLSFSPRSHRLQAGRDLEISDESEVTMKRRLEEFGCDEQAFAVGDVSFHAGWTFHRAGANRTGRMREVFTVIYMDAEMRLAQPRNKLQVVDREAWCPNVQPGEVIDAPLTPEI